MKRKDEYSIDLRTEGGRLDYAQQLWHRYCEDMAIDVQKAHVRLISGIQIALREAIDGGHIEPLVFYREDTK